MADQDQTQDNTGGNGSGQPISGSGASNGGVADDLTVKDPLIGEAKKKPKTEAQKARDKARRKRRKLKAKKKVNEVPEGKPGEISPVNVETVTIDEPDIVGKPEIETVVEKESEIKVEPEVVVVEPEASEAAPEIATEIATETATDTDTEPEPAIEPEPVTEPEPEEVVQEPEVVSLPESEADVVQEPETDLGSTDFNDEVKEPLPQTDADIVEEPLLEPEILPENDVTPDVNKDADAASNDWKLIETTPEEEQNSYLHSMSGWGDQNQTATPEQVTDPDALKEPLAEAEVVTEAENPLAAFEHPEQREEAENVTVSEPNIESEPEPEPAPESAPEPETEPKPTVLSEPAVIERHEENAVTEHDADLLDEDQPKESSFMGKLIEFVTGKRSMGVENLPAAREKVNHEQEVKPEKAVVKEVHEEDKAIAELDDDLADDDGKGSDAARVIGRIVRYLLGGLLVVGLMIGAFWIGSQIKVLEWFDFSGDTGNGILITDAVLAQRNGFTAITIVGKNLGNKKDELLPHFKALFYFAKLKSGYLINSLNGVTAVTYYGLGLDIQFYTNRFIYYVDFLGQLRALYTVDLFAVLDNAVNRSEELDKFLLKTKEIYQSGFDIYNEMRLQLDDFTVTYNDLNTQKAALETDFFSNMELGFGEKAQALLEQFIEINQKQIEVKAKVGALNQLTLQYQKVLAALAKRIEAIEKNESALVEGVRVIEIPGSNIDFVIKAGSN